MTRLTLTGSRIRDRRLELGLKQAHLARDVGISPAYLNLIEHNKRRIGGKLLLDLARVLGVETTALSEGAQAELLAGLLAAAAQENVSDVARVEEFAGRFPGWAGVLAAQQARIEGLSHQVAALTDRLSYDPLLSDSLHDVLSAVTSIRSTASILAGPGAVDAEWQARFQGNLLEDAKRLAEGAGALASYLDGTVNEPAPGTPQEKLEAYLASRSYHLDEIEQGRDLVDASAGESLGTYVQRYRRDATRLPLAEFAPAYIDDPDPARLAARFEVDMAMVMRRIASLPIGVLPGPVGLVACDASGSLTFRKPVEGFALPRFGAGCPLWPLYQALQQPHMPLRIAVEHTGRDAPQFLTFAIAQPGAPAGYDAPPVLEATMLILPRRRDEEEGALRRVCSIGGCGGQH